MSIEELQQKEQFLTERERRLRSSLQELEQNLEVSNIEKVAEQVNSLQVQLMLTEKALQNTQDKLQAQKLLAGSKEHKLKQKQAQELRKQAEKETTEVFESLQVLYNQTESILKNLKQYDKLQRELTGETQYFATSQAVQPFAWLGLVHSKTRSLLAQTTWLKDKLS